MSDVGDPLMSVVTTPREEKLFARIEELEAELETYRSIYGRLSSRPELDKRLNRLGEKHRHQLKIMSDFSREARRAQREGDIEKADQMQQEAIRVHDEIDELVARKKEVWREMDRLERAGR